MSDERFKIVVETFETVVVALIPVMLALIAYFQFRHAAQQKERDKLQARRVRKISKVAKQQTEKLEEAMTARKDIAATQTRQIDNLSKSGQQSVPSGESLPVKVTNKEAIQVEVKD